MSTIICSNDVIKKIKKNLFEIKKISEEELKEKVQFALEREMQEKLDKLDTCDKMIAYLLSVGDNTTHSTNDMFVMYTDF